MSISAKVARGALNAWEFIQRYDNFLVLGHREPDGDCVGSQLVLAGWLARRGKRAEAVSVGPFDRPEVVPFGDRFADSLRTDHLDEETAVVVVDCSHPNRTGLDLELIQGQPSFVIDHHAAAERYGEVRLVDAGSPSTTILILDLIESFGDRPTEQEAELLLFGFCTDTGFFRHLDQRSASALYAVSRLAGYGASINSVYRMIYSGRNLAQFKLLGKLLERTERYAGGKVLLSWQTLRDIEGDEESTRGSDDFYKHLQSVKNNEVVILIKEEEDGECSVGLRSDGSLNVGELAHAVGGGGHPKASGFTVAGTIEEVKRMTLELMGRYYEL
jgi:phosphoesterase RecJ-like protein